MTTTEQFRRKLASRQIKCDYVNCKNTFVPKGKKIFCSDNCRKSQSKLNKSSKTVVLSADDRPSAIDVCLLEGCGAPLTNSRQKYCCEQHRKKASNQRTFEHRREYDRGRDSKVAILAQDLAKSYYSKPNGNSRIRFLERMIDSAFDPDYEDYSIIRRTMRSQKWREPDFFDKSMFHDADKSNLTICEIIENYFISFYGGNTFQMLNEEKRPQPSISPIYMDTLDTRSDYKQPVSNIIPIESKMKNSMSRKLDFDEEVVEELSSDIEEIDTPEPSKAIRGLNNYYNNNRKID